MAKTIDHTPIQQIQQESERTKHEPYPPGSTYTRPNRERSKVYSVRLSEEEYEAVPRVADAAHLPPSTLVRSWILARLDQERNAS